MDATKDAEPTLTWADLTRGNVGYLILVFCTITIGSSNDYTLSENSNFIPTALGFSGGQWGDLVGGPSLYIRGALCILFTGAVVDNIDIVRTIAIVLLTCALASILFPFQVDFGMWLALRYLYTIGGSSFLVILCATLGLTVTPKAFHGLASGVATSGSNGSDLLAIGLERIFTTNWKGSFYVEAALMALLGVLFFFFVPECAVREKRSCRLCPSVLGTYRLYGRMLVSSIVPWCMVVMLAGQGFVYATSTMTQQWLVDDLGMDAKEVANIMLAMPVVQLVGAFGIGVLGDFNQSNGRGARTLKSRSAVCSPTWVNKGLTHLRPTADRAPHTLLGDKRILRRPGDPRGGGDDARRPQHWLVLVVRRHPAEHGQGSRPR